MHTVGRPEDAVRMSRGASSKVGGWLQKRLREQHGQGPAGLWQLAAPNYSTLMAKSDHSSTTDHENTKLSDMASRGCRYSDSVPVLRNAESMQAITNPV